MSICKDLLKEGLLKEPDSECWRDQTNFFFVNCISCSDSLVPINKFKSEQVISEGFKQSSIL